MCNDVARNQGCTAGWVVGELPPSSGLITPFLVWAVVVVPCLLIVS
ncbi:BQ5605_C009g05692 [Microbotryum silenes-dioicae]|uniref:BQ5605_C009g05692 protein n=1 Tax=Microbotryum silenes-dioicae TaxID=796604 RepID=A0A2X0MIG7_9BASI|nr:BQ5605_C009g05692 [Microbotryum silenes-dioicae]